MIRITGSSKKSQVLLRLEFKYFSSGLLNVLRGFLAFERLIQKKERPTPRKWWAVHHEHSARVESLGFDLAVVDRHVQRGSRRPLREEPEAQGLATADS